MSLTQSLQWAQATVDIADRMILRTASKILNAPGGHDAAKLEVQKQVDRVRTVLRPGLVLPEHVVAADVFVVSAAQPAWEHVVTPDVHNLGAHPWSQYLVYYAARGMDDGDDGMAVDEVGESTSQGPCRACVDRGTTCEPQEGIRCVQCVKRRTKCSHSAPPARKRGRRSSLPSAAKRARTSEEPTLDAVDDPPVDTMESDRHVYTITLAPEPPTPSQSRSPTPRSPTLSIPRPEVAFVSIEEHNKLVDAYKQLEERIRSIEDTSSSRKRTVRSKV